MTLLLAPSDIKGLLSMEEAIGITESLFLDQSNGLVREQAPIHLRADSEEQVGHGALRIVAGGLLKERVLGTRFGAGGDSGSSLAALFDCDSGELLTVMPYAFSNDRAGATIAVATKWLAPSKASVVGLIGTGANAISHLQGIMNVRQLEHVKVYSRDETRRNTFARQASEVLQISVEAARSSAEAVDSADVVVSSTNSTTPVFSATDLQKTVHINSFGYTNEVPSSVWLDSVGNFVGNKRQERQLFCYQSFTGHGPPHALFDHVGAGVIDWDSDVDELGSAISGNWKRPATGLTIFKESRGGYGDIALAYFVYNKCRELGLGTEMTF